MRAVFRHTFGLLSDALQSLTGNFTARRDHSQPSGDKASSIQSLTTGPRHRHPSLAESGLEIRRTIEVNVTTDPKQESQFLPSWKAKQALVDTNGNSPRSLELRLQNQTQFLSKEKGPRGQDGGMSLSEQSLSVSPSKMLTSLGKRSTSSTEALPELQYLGWACISSRALFYSIYRKSKTRPNKKVMSWLELVYQSK